MTSLLLTEQVPTCLRRVERETSSCHYWDAWNDPHQEGSGTTQRGLKIANTSLNLCQSITLHYFPPPFSIWINLQVKYRMEGNKVRHTSLYDGEAREVAHVKHVSDLISKVSLACNQKYSTDPYWYPFIQWMNSEGCFIWLFVDRL